MGGLRLFWAFFGGFVEEEGGSNFGSFDFSLVCGNEEGEAFEEYVGLGSLAFSLSVIGGGKGGVEKRPVVIRALLTMCGLGRGGGRLISSLLSSSGIPGVVNG